jgi:hypothetical protein
MVRSFFARLGAVTAEMPRIEQLNFELGALRPLAGNLEREIETLRAEIETLRAEIAQKDSRTSALEAQTLEVLHSWSWRMTRPFRITPAKLRRRLRMAWATWLIRRSDLFDAKFYLESNPDVAAIGVDPVWHYVMWGAAEGRDPHPEFDTSLYLESNPDVAAAGINPLVHYLQRGATEGRKTSPGTR